jgi:hypothetical protein
MVETCYQKYTEPGELHLIDACFDIGQNTTRIPKLLETDIGRVGKAGGGLSSATLSVPVGQIPTSRKCCSSWRSAFSF